MGFTLLELLAAPFSARGIIVALLAPALGFFLGSPFIPFSLPLFLNHFAFEVWHYGVQGHVGHMAEPGLPQVLHYGRWLGYEAIGFLCLLAALIGMVCVTKVDVKKSAIFLLFPLLYFLLMINQKANFTRNMLVAVPFLCVFAALCISSLAKKVPFKESKASSWILLLLLSLQPAWNSISFLSEKGAKAESRREVQQWLIEKQKSATPTALSGKLQLPRFVTSHNGLTTLSAPGITRIASDVSIIELYLQGYDRLVFGPERELKENERALIALEKEFRGDPENKRIVDNPLVQAFTFRDYKHVLNEVKAKREKLTSHTLTYDESQSAFLPSSESASEGYIWLERRLQNIQLRPSTELAEKLHTKKSATLSIEVLSPWPQQKVIFCKKDSFEMRPLENDTPGTWQMFQLELPSVELLSNSGICIGALNVRSPKAQGSSSDERRLGIAIRKISLE